MGSLRRIRHCVPRICELFGVSQPIIQTGMGYVSGPELTIYGSSAMSPRPEPSVPTKRLIQFVGPVLTG